MEKADRTNHWYYNNALTHHARQHRNQMTKAEACIWKYLLRGRKLMGFLFNRQRPVGSYIADFMCKELMLIIEVDGFTHGFEDVAARDMQRQAALEKMGFAVIRFHDEEVLNDIGNVERRLVSYIEDFRCLNASVDP